MSGDIKKILRAIRDYSRFRYWETLRHQFTPDQQQAYDEVSRVLAMADASVLVSYLVDNHSAMPNLFPREPPPEPPKRKGGLTSRILQ